MRGRVGGCLLLCLAALMPRAWADVAVALDLAAFVERVEQNDAGMAAARADVMVGHEGRLRALAGFFPRVDMSWSRSRNSQQYEGSSGQGFDSSQRQITLNQPLFDWTAVSNYRQAQAQEARKHLQLLQASQALRLRAVERYFAALVARDEAQLNADTDAALRTQLANARARSKGGEATLIDLRDIEAELARSANALANARTQHSLRLRELEAMAGLAIARLAGLPAALAIPPLYPDVLEHWAAQAASSHPEVQLREMDRKLAALATDHSRGEFLPRLTLQASQGRTSATTSGFFSYPAQRSRSVGVQLNIPIFSGFDTVHGVRQGLARQDKAFHDAEAARRQVQVEVGESFAQARAQRRSVDDLERYVAATQAALAATRIGRDIGNRRDADILQKQNMLLGAQRELSRARYEALVQSLRLKALTASLGVEDIRAVSALLEDRQVAASP